MFTRPWSTVATEPPPFDTPTTSTDTLSRFMGLSFLGTLMNGLLYGQSALRATASAGKEFEGISSPYILDTLKLFLLGWLFESGRRFFDWIKGVFKPFQYSILAEFGSGDPAYDWITLLLTEEKIWNRSRRFRVHSTSSQRRWSVELKSQKQRQDQSSKDHAEYVPQYQEEQLFKWKGYWVHVSKSNVSDPYHHQRRHSGVQPDHGFLFLTLYTRDMSVLSALVEDARERYLKASEPHVIVHTADMGAFDQGDTLWSLAKRKARRPLSSIILQEGVVNSLLDDVRDFFDAEDWYRNAGIPFHRGYLLYGPPGTGKTSTIYAIAGELGLEIYSISLASSFVDDAFLARTLASIPKRAIFLLEDIDCAFSSRDDLDLEPAQGHISPYGMGPSLFRARGRLTLSGLLNALDGVGSEEGKIFFATTNYIDRLDPALLRPGRIDKKIEYKRATAAQAAALFLRFYPPSLVTLRSERSPRNGDEKRQSLVEKDLAIQSLSKQFAASVPEYEFSIAELQGFLLLCRQDPERAVEEIGQWVADERKERASKEDKMPTLKKDTNPLAKHTFKEDNVLSISYNVAPLAPTSIESIERSASPAPQIVTSGESMQPQNDTTYPTLSTATALEGKIASSSPGVFSEVNKSFLNGTWPATNLDVAESCSLDTSLDS